MCMCVCVCAHENDHIVLVGSSTGFVCLHVVLTGRPRDVRCLCACVASKECGREVKPTV